MRTGEVEEVSASEVPSAPAGTGVTVSPAGGAVSAATQGGRAEVVLTDAAGLERVLLSASVSPDYLIRAIWAPNREYVLAYDGRLLVITADDPAVTRVLAADAGGVGSHLSSDPLLEICAVTDLNLLEP